MHSHWKNPSVPTVCLVVVVAPESKRAKGHGGVESGHQVYVHEAIAQLSHWPYVKVPCLGIRKGHEISSGSRVQKITGFSIINDNISHGLIADNLCQWISIQQSRWHSIMFLPCLEVCRGKVWTILGKGGNMGLMCPYLLLPTHFNFLYFTRVAFILVDLDWPLAPGACQLLLVFAGPQEVFKNSGSNISHCTLSTIFRFQGFHRTIVIELP